MRIAGNAGYQIISQKNTRCFHYISSKPSQNTAFIHLRNASTADSEIHRLLLDCNTTEQEILTRTVKELKAILYGLGI